MTVNTKYNPDKHHRRSIRLCGYDYAQEGLYFVTICCQDRMFLFGEIVNGEMVLNDAGQMVEKWYYKTAEKFSHIRCLDMVVMPNHFHCIWQIENDFTVTNVGANPCVRPDDNAPCVRPDDNTPCVRPIIKRNEQMGRHVGEQMGRHVGLPLHRVVQWFKTMTTNEYIRGVEKYDWIPFNRKLWQRNYYEHIIRNAESYANIAEYITNNPAAWQNDIFFIK